MLSSGDGFDIDDACSGSRATAGLIPKTRVPTAAIHPDFRSTDGSSVAAGQMLRVACPAAFRLCTAQDASSTVACFEDIQTRSKAGTGEGLG